MAKKKVRKSKGTTAPEETPNDFKRCPLPILSDILVRSSDSGNVRELILYSTVSKQFAEAVKAVRSLNLMDVKLDLWMPQDRQNVLCSFVRLTPKIKELTVGTCGRLSDISVGPCILYWSVVIGNKINTFNATRCSFTARHLSALGTMQALTRVSFHNCKLVSTSGLSTVFENDALFPNVEELSLSSDRGRYFKCSETESLHFLVQCAPRLQVFKYVNNAITRFDLDITSESLTSLNVRSCATLKVKTPNLKILNLGGECQLRSWKFPSLKSVYLENMPCTYLLIKKLRGLLKHSSELEEATLGFEFDKVDPLVAVECVTKVSKLKSLYPTVKFVRPWMDRFGHDSKKRRKGSVNHDGDLNKDR